MMNSFYIQKSSVTTSNELKISDYSLFDKKVENSSPVVTLLKGVFTNKEQESKMTKEQLFSEFEEQLKQLPYKDGRTVLKMRNQKIKK